MASDSPSSSSRRAVIIGGGLGGLATALRLAVRGWHVTLCEQGDSLGGKMNVLCRDGFRFDTGPSLITMPWVFEELFAAAGSSLGDHLHVIPVDPITEYVYDDGTRFTYTSSMPEWLETLRRIAPDDVDGFLRFMEMGARLFEVSRATFLRRPPTNPPDRESLAAMRHLPLRYGWGNYHRTVEAHFTSPYLRQLYDRYPTYVGSSPYASPATLAVIPYIEYAFGGWYVQGGLYRIVESLSALACQHGATLLTNARVEKIERRGERVCGIVLNDGTQIDADIVVMNGDASMTAHMLGEKNGALPEKERSMSGLVFLLGVQRTLPELQHHTIYFSSDYRREFAQLFEERRFPDDPTVYVNAPSRSDRSVVPGEGEALFVMANAPANDNDTWDDAMIDDAWQRVAARLRRGGFPEIEQDIVVRDVWTPRRIGVRYGMPGGAIYGTHSHGWRHAFMRPPNKDRHVGWLYYVGGSTHPGGGTPTVLLSAKITDELIAQHERS